MSDTHSYSQTDSLSFEKIKVSRRSCLLSPSLWVWEVCCVCLTTFAFLHFFICFSHWLTVLLWIRVYLNSSFTATQCWEQQHGRSKSHQTAGVFLQPQNVHTLPGRQCDWIYGNGNIWLKKKYILSNITCHDNQWCSLHETQVYGVWLLETNH